MDAHSSDRDDPVVAAARAGDEAAFTRLVERHRRELRVHCYRMVGSGCPSAGRTGRRVAFHEPALFPTFGLPDTVPADGG